LTHWVSVSLSLSNPVAIEDDEWLQSNTSVEISLVYVSGTKMRELNAQYRNKDQLTNVLSFPADMPVLPDDASEHKTLVLGDIIICPEVLITEAQEQHKALEHHWAHMLVHSVLHLNGLDHNDENSAEAMEQLEIRILSKLGIANPYLAASATQT